MDVAALHRTMFEVIQTKDFAALRALYHPDYVYVSESGEEQKGAEAGIAVAETYLTAFPDMRMEIRSQVAAGDASVLELTCRGTQTGDLPGVPATGRSIEVHLCNTIVVADGKIVREHDYFDNLALLQQLGVAER